MPDLDILLGPLVACLVLAGIHCYLGIHILMREVIFVDLALAQVAALGAAVGLLFGISTEGIGGYMAAFSFTLIGAFVFAIGRFRDRRVPQEALIGIVYAVAFSCAMLIFSQSGLDREHIEDMLNGRLLFVDWPEIRIATALYVFVVVVHLFCWRPFLKISRAHSSTDLPPSYRTWDFVFYATFGIVVTSSVKMAGVLLVFSFLIVPAACAALFYQGFRNRLIAGWIFGIVGSVFGISASWQWDLPTGYAIVAAFGAIFGICAVASAIRARLASHQAAAMTRSTPPEEAEPAGVSPDSSGRS